MRIAEEIEAENKSGSAKDQASTKHKLSKADYMETQELYDELVDLSQEDVK